MATGEQPFSGETMTSVSYKVVHTDPIPPSKLNPAVPSGLEAVILKCLAKNPAERHQIGDDLARALSAQRSKSAGPSQEVPAHTTLAADATIEATPSLRVRRAAQAAEAAATPIQVPAPPTRQRSNLVLIAAALVVLAIANGIAWFGLHRSQPVPATPATPSPTATQPAAASEPGPAAPAAMSISKPSPATLKEQPAPTVSAPAPVPTVSKAAAAVDFNPKMLDPKQNTRLKLDLSKVPVAFPFTVQLDGKIYYRGTAGNKQDFDTLYAPPGVHELRITVGTGSRAKTSNTVSGDFAAKKRMSLKVELRPAPTGSAAALDSAMQVVASLKQDRFFF